ncbi:MAG TPA: DUF2911 domain-containing protein [Pyrinomonadaceae bacterium]|nr:DUF2911 domain-containing protein [Pyrinomonadaceae bacterium]
MKRLLLTAIFVTIFNICAFAQIAVLRESNKASVMQTVGDTTITITYHRPNVKGRKVWGDLVPYNTVWRTGANDATLFEISNDVMINGQKLPKGKYSLYTIPTSGDWTVIFNKSWNQWGTVYDAKEDQLRVTAKPMAGEMKETFAFEFGDVKNTATDVVIAWEKLRVPFTVDVGDFNARVLNDYKSRMIGDPVQAANLVMSAKLKANYEEALGWLNNSIATRETFGNLGAKARLLAEMGRNAEAITTAEKAIQVGKTATPAANTSALETLVKDLKAKK